MTTIWLPAMGVFKKDVETMVSLLQRTVPKSYEIGLDIIGKTEHFQEAEYLERIAENLKALSAVGVHLSVHGFSGLDVYESGLGDMRNVAGKRLLLTYLRLAADINAEYVHVHSGAGYKVSLPVEKKQEHLLKVRQHLINCVVSYPRIKVGIENLPSPSAGDLETDPDKVWRDCVDNLESCLLVVADTGLKVTLDTCHLAAGVKDEDINLVHAVQTFGDHLYFLHVSDVEGYWVPYKSVWKEGIIPGEGRIGMVKFEQFFHYLKSTNIPMNICVEINNKSFDNPLESEESIRRIVGWLED